VRIGVLHCVCGVFCFVCTYETVCVSSGRKWARCECGGCVDMRTGEKERDLRAIACPFM
jgi:hypothetical protein